MSANDASWQSNPPRRSLRILSSCIGASWPMRLSSCPSDRHRAPGLGMVGGPGWARQSSVLLVLSAASCRDPVAPELSEGPAQG